MQPENGLSGSLQRLNVVKATQQSLDAHWPWLRERLLDIKASNEYPRLGDRRVVDRAALAASFGQSGRCRWLPEQVRWSILKGFQGTSPTELFYVVDPKDEILGFFITLTNIDPIAGVPLDFVLWLGWSSYPRLLEEVAPEVRRLAEERGCTAAEHSSSRSGWFRRLWGCGNWQLKYWTWRWEFK